MDGLCQKSPSASIPLVVLDNFYKLNLFFVTYFRLTVSSTWFVITV